MPEHASEVRSASIATPGDSAAPISTSGLMGRREAELFEQRLRERERLERDELLALPRETAHDTGQLDAGETPSSSDLASLRRQIQQLAEFQRSVVRSRGWRLLQLLRRPFGRQW